MITSNLYEARQAAGAVLSEDGATVMHYGDVAAEYNAALTGTVLIDGSAAGRIWMRDRDAAALLNRLSTNKIEGLVAGQGAQTVLTTPIGRIIDLLTVHGLPEGLLLVTSPPQRATVLKHLRKNIFFNDRVALADANEEFAQLMLYGPQSAGLLAGLCGADVADLALYATTQAVIAGNRLTIAHVKPIGGHGFALYVPAAAAAAAWEALRGAGAVPAGTEAFELLRIEAGYGAYGRELSLDYIPLEAGLWDAVSFSKGCYVGQEIIARMESRNRIAKLLRGLRLSGPITEIPAKLTVEGKEAGTLTSAVVSPGYGPIALAYVRSAFAEPGTCIGVAGSDVTGEVVELPFAGR